MKPLPPVGVPLLDQYREVLKEQTFRDLEEFSSRFIELHANTLSAYGRRWSTDPLHEWSRQWEYPFVSDVVSHYLEDQGAESAAVFDAGSGITFFPYFLAQRHPQIDLVCCDQDRSLGPLFDQINTIESPSPRFYSAGLENLKNSDGSCDVVYCISVLEHSRNEEKILAEFNRVLRPGGILILTFDISLDGEADIEPARAQWLLARIEELFESVANHPTIDNAIGQPEIVTTLSVRREGLSIPPWRHPWLSAARSILRGRIPRKLFKALTVYAGVWRKLV